MILKGDFKLIFYSKLKKYRLFNVKNDPKEIADLADHPEYAPLLATMKKDLASLMSKMGDDLDLNNPVISKAKNKSKNKNKKSH
jgi:arylsulfatase A-like enzyme